jgi:segregation and condensation protein B
MEISLEKIIESIIFVSDQPVSADDLLEIVNQSEEEEQTDEKEEGQKKLPLQFSEAEVAEALNGLVTKYQEEKYPFEIQKVAKGYQFFTKREFYPFVKKASVVRNQKRLTRATLETLAIVAYRQPVTKAEVEFIRGVNCDYAIQKLLDKKLVEIQGRADAIGKPLLYGTSTFFMEYFGINGVEDLPKLKEFEEMVEDHLELFKQQEAAEGDEGTPQPELPGLLEDGEQVSPDAPTTEETDEQETKS